MQQLFFFFEDAIECEVMQLVFTPINVMLLYFGLWWDSQEIPSKPTRKNSCYKGY